MYTYKNLVEIKAGAHAPDGHPLHPPPMHFTPWQTWALQRHIDLCGKNSATVQLLRELYSFTCSQVFIYFEILQCFNHFTTASHPKLCVMKVEITKKTVPSPSLVNITQKKRKITIITTTVAVELVSELDTLTALEEVRRGLVGDT